MILCKIITVIAVGVSIAFAHPKFSVIIEQKMLFPIEIIIKTKIASNGFTCLLEYKKI